MNNTFDTMETLDRGGAGFAWLPIAGAIAFLVNAILTQRADIFQERLLATGERPILPRAWSQASADPIYDGHWYFCFSAIFFASTLSATALWQYAASSEEALVLLIFGEISAVFLFLTAIVPTSSETIPIRVLHAVTAGTFLATGANYSMQAAFLVEEGLFFIVRLVCAVIVFASITYMLFGGLYLYYVAAGKLMKQKNGKLQLTAKEELKARLHMSFLSLAQGSAGVAMAVTLATGAFETSNLSMKQVTMGAIVGFSSLAVMTVITVIAYLMRPTVQGSHDEHQPEDNSTA